MQRTVQSSHLLLLLPDAQCMWNARAHRRLLSDWCAELQANSSPLSPPVQACADVYIRFRPQPCAFLARLRQRSLALGALLLLHSCLLASGLAFRSGGPYGETFFTPAGTQLPHPSLPRTDIPALRLLKLASHAAGWSDFGLHSPGSSWVRRSRPEPPPSSFR